MAEQENGAAPRARRALSEVGVMSKIEELLEPLTEDQVDRILRYFDDRFRPAPRRTAGTLSGIDTASERP